MNTSSASNLTLGDLLLGIFDYRWLVLALAALVFVMGALVSGLQEPQFEHSTTLEIGQIQEHQEMVLGDGFRIEGGRRRPVESVNDVQEKLERGYIPAVLQRLEARQEEASTRIPDVRVFRPTGSDLLVIQSRGTTDESEMLRDLHRDIVERVREDHAAVLQAERQRLQRGLARSQADLERVEALAALLDEESGATSDTRTARVEYEYQAASSRAAVQEYRARLEAVRETRAPILAHPERTPVQPPLPVMLVLWLMVGLVVGLLAAGIVSTLRGAAGRARVS